MMTFKAQFGFPHPPSGAEGVPGVPAEGASRLGSANSARKLQPSQVGLQGTRLNVILTIIKSRFAPIFDVRGDVRFK